MKILDPRGVQRQCFGCANVVACHACKVHRDLNCGISAEQGARTVLCLFVSSWGRRAWTSCLMIFMFLLLIPNMACTLQTLDPEPRLLHWFRFEAFWLCVLMIPVRFGWVEPAERVLAIAPYGALYGATCSDTFCSVVPSTGCTGSVYFEALCDPDHWEKWWPLRKVMTRQRPMNKYSNCWAMQSKWSTKGMSRDS
jgi:hypothetical protein